jgi:hypothetical protein
VLEAGAVDPHARLLEISQLEIAPPSDDPFAPAPKRVARRPAVPAAPPVLGRPGASPHAAGGGHRLAERDPDAADESGEYETSGEYRASTATEALLRRARLQGFLAGSAAGAVAAAVIAALLAVATSRPEPRTTTITTMVAASQEPAAVEPAAAPLQPPEPAPEPAPAPAPPDPGRRAVPSQRRTSGEQAPAPRRAAADASRRDRPIPEAAAAEAPPPDGGAVAPLGVDLVPAAADRAPPPPDGPTADRFGSKERDALVPAASESEGEREKLR